VKHGWLLTVFIIKKIHSAHYVCLTNRIPTGSMDRYRQQIQITDIDNAATQQVFKKLINFL